MKITLVALLIAVTNIAIAQNHDHHSGHGKQISHNEVLMHNAGLIHADYFPNLDHRPVSLLLSLS